METMLQRRREAPAAHSGSLDDIFSADEGGLVTVSSGLHNDERLPVANMTVGEVRRRFADRMDIDQHSRATVDGHDVDDTTVLRPGQLLIFMQHAGEKGTQLWTL
jgi:hypothetical protein